MPPDWLDKVFEEAKKAYAQLPVWARPVVTPPLATRPDSAENPAWVKEFWSEENQAKIAGVPFSDCATSESWARATSNSITNWHGCADDCPDNYSEVHRPMMRNWIEMDEHRAHLAAGEPEYKDGCIICTVLKDGDEQMAEDGFVWDGVRGWVHR